MKYLRRPDFTPESRILLIAQAIVCQGVYGARTELALRFGISRAYLYQMLSIATLCLSEVLAEYKINYAPERLSLDAAILLFRLDAQLSISQISEILKRLGYANDSVGMISERLKLFGGRVPHVLYADKERLVFYVSDEIFALGCPILITIDPVSTAILCIELAPNRQADTWKDHFQVIEKHNFIPSGLCSDRGNGIVAGFQAAFDGVMWCSDHFHEFRDLIKLCHLLERQAYAAIGEEAERERVLDNAKSEATRQKRQLAYEAAKADCTQKIAEYQHVSDLLDLLFPTLYFFDLATGLPHREAQVKSDVLAMMDLLDELTMPKLQKQTKAIREHIDDICVCYQQVESSWKKLSSSISEEALAFIALAWQHDHQSHQHKGDAKRYHLGERDFWIEVATSLIADKSEQLIAEAFEQFNGLVRTSSLIEMVNSRVRPYLNNCKGQITQEYLNLIMFYHNHRCYQSGRRKGKAPIELLTGVTLEKDWLELLTEQVTQSK